MTSALVARASASFVWMVSRRNCADGEDNPDQRENDALQGAENGVDDGTRTHDSRDHNPGLYQLSYAHH